MIIETLLTILGFQLQGQQQARRYLANIKGISTAVTGLEARARTASRALAAIPALLAGSAGARFAKSIYETAESIETMNTQLMTLYKDRRKVQQATTWIEDFAKRSPMTLAEVTQNFIDMRLRGINPMSGALEALAEAAVNQREPAEALKGTVRALGQAWQEQKLTAEEAEQLTEHGIPVFELLARGLGKTTQQIRAMMKAGKIGRQEMGVLIKMIGKEYAGASKAASETSKGIRSMIGDVWTRIVTDFMRVGEGEGPFAFIKSKMKDLLTFMDEAQKSGVSRKWSDDFLEGLKAIDAFIKGWEFNEYLRQTVRELNALYDIGKAIFDFGKQVRQWVDPKDVDPRGLSDFPQHTGPGAGRRGVGPGGGLDIPGAGIPPAGSPGDPLSGLPSPRRGAAGGGGAAPLIERHFRRGAQGISGENAQTVYASLRARGWTPQGAQAMVGNLFGEGLQSPGRTWSDPSRSGRSGISGGIASWRNERLRSMQAATGGMPGGWTSVANQADYLDREVRRMGLFNAVNTPDVATNVGRIVRDFERPAYPGAEAAKRYGYARRFRPRAGTVPAVPATGFGVAPAPKPTLPLPTLPEIRMPPTGNLTGAGAAYNDNSAQNVTVNVAGSKSSADEIASKVTGVIRNRGRDQAKSMFLRAQEPATA